MKTKGLKIIFYVSILSLLLMSITVLFMPLASEQARNDNPVYLYAVGGSFWGMLLLSYVLLLCMTLKRKNLCKKLYTKKKDHKDEKMIKHGKSKFMFSNKVAGTMDALLILSATAFLACMLGTEGYAAYVSLSCVIFFFHMHFLWNGKTYEVIVNYSNHRGGKK